MKLKVPSEESYKKVEGDWKDFRFRRILPEDWPLVFEHIGQNFVRDEETSKLLGWSQEFADDVNRVVEKFLAHGMSFLAEHRPTGKIAGVRITFNHTPLVSFDDIPLNSRSAQLLLKFVNELEEKADVKGKHGIDSFAELFIASTSPDFRNQGLAGEFYDRSIEFLKSEGYKHALVVVTSPWTKRATRKRGFQEQSRIDYHDFYDFEGKRVFKDEVLTPDHCAMVMLKKL